MSDNEDIDNLADVEQLFEAFTKRKYWKKIRQDVIRAIFDNAKKDVLKIKAYRRWDPIKILQRFRTVSEELAAVKNKFISIAKDERIVDILSNYAMVLRDIASFLIKKFVELEPNSQQQSLIIALAEMGLHSSILCDPLYLIGYQTLAAFYNILQKGSDTIEVCTQYDLIEKELLQTPDDQLSFTNRVAKRNENGILDSLRKDINEFKNTYEKNRNG